MTMDTSATQESSAHPRFNRRELAGSLGDLGTLLPIAMGMVLINGLDPVGLFLSVGLFYICSGFYFRTTSPVQPMKVIGAYALATGVGALDIGAAGLLMAALLLALAFGGAIGRVAAMVPREVVRGVQMATGVLLMMQGIKLVLGLSKLQQLKQAAEPFLAWQALGPLPLGLLIGLVAFSLTLFFLNSKRFPAGLVVVAGGLVAGWALAKPVAGGGPAFSPALPGLLPFGLPSWANFSFAFFAMALPQLPMTIGNAVVANADLAQEYFGQRAGRVTPKGLCVAMGLANLGAFVLGGMPLCTGAGGLAAHYRFGARTSGSNLMIGALFVALALLLGPRVLALVSLLPMAVLGVLLLFAGGQLALTLADVKERKQLFVVLMMLVVTLAFDLAWAFGVGLLLAYLLKWDRLQI